MKIFYFLQNKLFLLFTPAGIDEHDFVANLCILDSHQ